MSIISDSWLCDLVALVVGAISVLYLMARWKYSYWHRKGFKSISGVNFLFGNFSATFLQRESFVETLDTLYRATNERFVGIYTIFRPILLIRDTELVRTILTTDFKHFTDRGLHCNENYDPISANLLTLRGDRWKKLRTKMSPVFTTSKMKAIFVTLFDCGKNLKEFLTKFSDAGELMDIRELSAAYTTNTIASAAFGIDADAVNNPNDPFRVNGRKIFDTTNLANSIRRLMYFVTPEAMSFFRIRTLGADVEHFLTTFVKQNLEYREKSDIVRKDFFQLLIQLRNSGSVQNDDEWETTVSSKGNNVHLTLNEIIGQTFLFFAAGFETSSSTLAFCMYELAKNPEIQARAHEEIDRVLMNHGGNITYESMAEMKYMDCCVDETLRKYAIAPMLSRTCVKDYKIPETNQIIEKGVEVFIPTYSLGNDPKYYDEPATFNPDRFKEKRSATVNQLNRPFYAFGDGPRNCIGMRLGLAQIKVGLVSMLQHFTYELAAELKTNPLQFEPKSFMVAPRALKLHVHKR